MVNTLAAIHNLQGKKFPQAKLKEDIHLRFPADLSTKRRLGIKIKEKPETQRNIQMHRL
jgi:hypothetical protein